jgi:hypothetical protein
MSKEALTRKFDQWIESRTSIVLNWFWKSGLFLFLIGMIIQNLGVQRDNSNLILANSASIKLLITQAERLLCDVDENKKKLESLNDRSIETGSEIKYLRRDVDGLMLFKGDGNG